MLPAVNGEDSGTNPFLLHRDCPGGFELGFRSIIPTLGDFTVASQRPIPPGLTVSPQASHSVCPTVEAYAADVTSTAAD